MINHVALPDPVPGLISLHSINLIIGSPTSGKTTLALTELERYHEAREFLGYSLLAGQVPAQCAAITCGSLGTLHKRVEQMELDHCSNPVTFPMTNWGPKREDGEEEDDKEKLKDRLYRHYDQLSSAARRPIRFMFVDNFQMMMAEKTCPTRIKDVYRFYETINEWLVSCNMALLGTVGQGKMKNGDSYPLLADRIYGSIAWAQGAETLIGIHPISFKTPQEDRGSSARQVIVAPARSRTVSWRADFTDLGRLEKAPLEMTAEESTAAGKLTNWWNGLEMGSDFNRAQLLEVGAGLSAATSSVDRWIHDMSDEALGYMEKVGRGKATRFKKPFRN